MEYHINCVDFSDGDAEEDLIRLEIYNKRLETTKIEQVVAVTFEQVVGNAGGLLGLWLGASMLTIMEFLEFFSNIVCCFWLKMLTCRRGIWLKFCRDM